MSRGLTPKQERVLTCIKNSFDERGYAPTVRELCDALSLHSPSTVHAHLRALEDAGYIHRDSSKARSITLADEVGSETLYEDTHVIALPRVGEVAAGLPLLAEENIQEYVSLPTDIVTDSASFLLTVRGESMIEAGINDGDTIVVREQQTARNGEIVVALIDDGATVKRFYKEQDHIRLQPENSSMEPIIVQDCSIVGKVVALFRRIY